jgi:hypothetical protein
MIFGEGEYPTKYSFSCTEDMGVGPFVGELVLFFNPVQFHQIERSKPQFFYWLLDYPVGGKIKRRSNARHVPPALTHPILTNKPTRVNSRNKRPAFGVGHHAVVRYYGGGPVLE